MQLAVDSLQTRGHGMSPFSIQLRRIGWFLILILTASLPWDLFQRIPFTSMTVSKIAGSLLILTCFSYAIARRRFPRTHLELPLAFFAAACVVATLISLDQAASLAILKRYAGHLLLFYATVICVQNRNEATMILRVYCLSALGVAALTFLCKTGVLLPADWQPTVFPYAGRLIEQAREGVVMRMTAASPDLNQGALLLLIAFALSWGAPAKDGLKWRSLMFLVQLAFVGALFISQSRSALLCVAAIMYLSVARYCKRKTKWALPAFLLATMVFAAIFHQPVLNWLDRPDSSVSSRAEAYRAALRLVPSHLVLGTGLGVSDQALAQTPNAKAIAGQTIHSVPLKFLIEMGVLGLAAYLGIWVALGYRTWRTLLRSPERDGQRLGASLLYMGSALFAMQLVQPFTALPHYPVLLGIWCGALAGTSEHASAPQPRRPLTTLFTVATAIPIALLVTGNLWLYQKGSKRVIEFAEVLTLAPGLEKAGNWAAAQTQYEKALSLALPKTTGERRGVLEPSPLGQISFYDQLAVIVDVPQIENLMNVLFESPDPAAVSLYGIGRTALAQGDTTTATTKLMAALDIEPAFADLHFVLAECFWATAHYDEALTHYQLAATHEQDWRNLRFRFRMAEWDERIAELAGETSIPGRLERAYLLRRRGRWPEAVAIYQAVYEVAPKAPEAIFGLGVEAALNNDTNLARTYWEGLANDAPDAYPDAYRALAEFSNANSNEEGRLPAR